MTNSMQYYKLLNKISFISRKSDIDKVRECVYKADRINVDEYYYLLGMLKFLDWKFRQDKLLNEQNKSRANYPYDYNELDVEIEKLQNKLARNLKIGGYDKNCEVSKSSTKS